MAASPPPQPRAALGPPASLLDEEVSRLALPLFRARAPISLLLASLICGVAWLDPRPWRVALMGGLALLVVLGAWVSAARARRHGVDATVLSLNVVVMWLLQLGGVVGTGGVDSPLLPILVPLAFGAGLLIARPLGVLGLVSGQALLVLVLTALQTGDRLPPLTLPQLGGPEAHGSAGRWAAAGVLVLVFCLASFAGAQLRRAFQRSLDRAVVARSDQLRAWEQHSSDLQRLGAEIAHELKNPLASVKGLAALIARELPSDRAGERMGVMRGEIDRMQQILEEFLAFSRPLSPLALRPVDMGDLSREVLALHEGLASERGVGLRFEGEGEPVPADPRKLVQLLINLVLNAIQASPRGATVGIHLRPHGGGLLVEVQDRGPGVPSDLGDRVFEAGVTGRPDGSGLGLPLALAIARQHGGDLRLLDRPGGGTLAQLSLPAAPLSLEQP